MTGAARPRILVATSEQAAAIVERMLADAAELVYAHSLKEACDALLAGTVDAIVAGLHFDDSLMPVLLETVKGDPRTRDIPFHCCRFLSTQLSPASLAAVQRACEALDSLGFIDLPEWELKYGAQEAGHRFRDIVLGSARRQR